MIDSSRKAVGLLAAKTRLLGGFPLSVYFHLYNSLVIPVMDYSAGTNIFLNWVASYNTK